MNIQEIKFNGVRVDDGEVLEGDLVHSIYHNGDVCIKTKEGRMEEIIPLTLGCDYIENIERELIEKNNKIAELLRKNKKSKEFEIGDRVFYTDDESQSIRQGSAGTIKDKGMVDFQGTLYTVEFDEAQPFGGFQRYVYKNYLERL